MSVTATISFLTLDPLYDGEKPFRFKFQPPSGVAETNVILERCEVPVQDIREHRDEIHIEEQGFNLYSSKTSLAYEEFDDHDKVETIYLKEVAEFLKEQCRASRVQISW